MATTQFLLALSGPALMFVVSLLSKTSGMATTWLAAQFVFPALAALCGMLGGYQFPIATEIYLHDDSGRSRWVRSMPSTCWADARARFC